MKIEHIYIDKNPFGKIIEEWVSTFNITNIHTEPLKSNSGINKTDNLVVFHANHDISKQYMDLIDLFESRQKNVCKIDLKGTLAAGKSNFELWLDRNQPEDMLIIGEGSLSNNENTIRFLEAIQLK